MFKQGKAIGSGTADPAQAPAAAAPVPPIVVEDKPAPGQRGPKGISPRTSYSRVNTGEPPTPDARGSMQKNQPPRGMEFLPRKTAHVEDRMSSEIQSRPTIQDMLKAAMEGTLNRVDITKEANVQSANQGEVSEEEIKEAAQHGHIPTDQINKLANAVDFIATKVAEEASRKEGPGQGPGALNVQSATSSEENIDAGQMGQASSGNQPPKVPSTQTEVTQSGKANTGLESNDDMSHPEQPVDPWGNEKGKTSSAVERILKLAEGLPPALKANKIPEGADLDKLAKSGEPSIVEKKQSMGMTVTASAPIADIRRAFSKVAEDAINPAKISSGKDTPPDASASEEGVPSEPSDVTSQKGMVQSNDAAINYKKREAKADPKSDVNKVLDENAQTKATDKTLHKTLDHTQEAGAKISSAIEPNEHEKVAAVRALLAKFASEHEDEKKNKKKEKESQIDPSPSAQTPTPASSMGPMT